MSPVLLSLLAPTDQKKDCEAELDSTFHGSGGYSNGFIICNTTLLSTANASDPLDLYDAQSSAAISQSLLAPTANAFAFDESDVAGSFAQDLPQRLDDIKSPDSPKFVGIANTSSPTFDTPLYMWHKSESPIFNNSLSSHLHMRSGSEPWSDSLTGMEPNVSTPCIDYPACLSTSTPSTNATRRKKDQLASRRLRATKRKPNRVTTTPR